MGWTKNPLKYLEPFPRCREIVFLNRRLLGWFFIGPCYKPLFVAHVRRRKVCVE